MLSHTLCVPFIRFQRAALDQRRLSRVFPLKQRYKIFIDAGVIDASQHLDLFLFCVQGGKFIVRIRIMLNSLEYAKKGKQMGFDGRWWLR